jgi:hypothetical protein
LDISEAQVLTGAGVQWPFEGLWGTVMRENEDGSWSEASTDGSLADARVSGLVSAPSDSSILYAALMKTGVYKSEDGGRTWHEKSAGLPSPGKVFKDAPRVDIRVHPENPSIVYVADRALGLYKSTNGGDLWEKKDNGVSFDGNPAHKYLGFAIDPASPEVLYLATAEGRKIYTIK